MCLRFLLHPLYLFLFQTAGSGNRYLLFLTSTFILSLDTENAVSIHIKADIYLWHSSRCRQYAVEHKPPQRPVVRRHRSLALNDMDFHAGLVIGGSAENLALRSRYGGITGNKGGSYPTESLYSESKGSNIQQEDVLNVSF